MIAKDDISNILYLLKCSCSRYLRQKAIRYDILNSNHVNENKYKPLPATSYYVSQNIGEYKERLLKFRAKIAGLEEAEQPNVEIPFLNDLGKQDLIAWTEHFRYVQKICEWSDDQSNSIIQTLISPTILKLVANRRTAKTILEGLKSHCYPIAHYRRYRNKIEKLSVKNYMSIRLFVEKFEKIIKEANACLEGFSQILDREKFDLFYKHLPEYYQKDVNMQNCTDIEQAIVIIEKI